VHRKIEDENRLILDRLGKAMQYKNIDNEYEQKGFSSLLETEKKKTMQRVARDNKRLLKSIQNTEPVYNSALWKRESEVHDEYLRNMTDFPQFLVQKNLNGVDAPHTAESSTTKNNRSSNVVKLKPIVAHNTTMMKNSQSFGSLKNNTKKNKKFGDPSPPVLPPPVYPRSEKEKNNNSENNNNNNNKNNNNDNNNNGYEGFKMDDDMFFEKKNISFETKINIDHADDNYFDT
jgi:hypothetical protein